MVSISRTLPGRRTEQSSSAEERDDGALSDGGDDMTPEQYGMGTPVAFRVPRCLLRQSAVFPAQMEAGLENIRTVFGTEERSGFTDSYIRESLWDCNFDVDETIESLTGMYHAYLSTASTNPDPSRRGAGENECCAREKR
jgi:hypothetical protein